MRGVDEHPLDPRRLLGALLRRKYMIASIMAVGGGIGLLYANQLTPLYSAQTTLLIEGAQQRVVPIESVAQGIKPDFYTNETQAAVLRSRDLIGAVVDRLDLYNDPDFNPDLAPPRASTFDVMKAALRGWLGLGGDQADRPRRDPYAGMTPEEKRSAQRETLIDVFLGGLTVIPSQRAMLVTVEYVAADPDVAAKAANATAEAYIRQQLEKKGSVTLRATEWLAQRASELRQRIIDSERRLEEHRRKSGIMEVQGINLLREQIAKVNTDLIAARTRRAEADARFHQVQSLLGDGGDIATAAAVLDSPLIQRLREQEAVLLRKLAELRTRLRDGHPQMVLARNELKDLQEKIGAEVNKIVVNLGNELEIARVRERGLQAELSRLERKVEGQNEAAVHLKSLQTEVQANKQLFDTINSRFKETSVVDEGLQQADARIISRATPPYAPFYPQKRVLLLISLFFSALAGTGIAVVLELLDSGFRTAQQLEEMTGLPTIGSLPRLGRADRRRYPHEMISLKPNSAFSESVRSVRTALMLSDAERTPRTVLITSSISGEGKTSLSLSLASLAARSGQRAIAVDCDFRHPNLHIALRVPNNRGLADYLSGQVELADIIDIDPATGLHFVTAGTRAPHPTDLLGSPRMHALLRRLEGSYDLTVLDAPPLLAVSDALVLVRVVDRVLYLVRWERVRRESVLAGIRQLLDAGAKLAGTVLTLIDVRKQSRYGYQGAGGSYYYGQNPKYYRD
jgi:capsular exopolysaccharide synthesis family protein